MLSFSLLLASKFDNLREWSFYVNYYRVYNLWAELMSTPWRDNMWWMSYCFVDSWNGECPSWWILFKGRSLISYWYCCKCYFSLEWWMAKSTISSSYWTIWFSNLLLVTDNFFSNSLIILSFSFCCSPNKIICRYFLNFSILTFCTYLSHPSWIFYFNFYICFTLF